MNVLPLLLDSVTAKEICVCVCWVEKHQHLLSALNSYQGGYGWSLRDGKLGMELETW
jgi:hypothetical protein